MEEGFSRQDDRKNKFLTCIVRLDDDSWLSCDEPEEEIFYLFIFLLTKVRERLDRFSSILRRGAGKGRARFCVQLSVPKENLWKSLIGVLGPKTGIRSAIYARLSGRESTEKPPSLLKAATPDGELASSDMSSKLGFLCMYCGANRHGTFPISCHLKEGLWTSVLCSPHH